MHLYTFTCAYSTRAHTKRHAPAHFHTHTHKCTCAHTHQDTCTLHTLTQTCTHAHMCKNAHIRTHEGAYIHAHVHPQRKCLWLHKEKQSLALQSKSAHPIQTSIPEWSMMSMGGKPTTNTLTLLQHTQQA